jgi:hypothetical protein
MSFTHVRVAALVLAAVAAGCASSAGPEEAVSTTDEALSTFAWTYVTVRADQRKCMSPLCGGYFVQDVNRRTEERYVSGLDYGPADLDAAALHALAGAADGELVLRGRLGPTERRFHTRPLLVREAYRGMPGMVVADGDALYQVSAREPEVRCVVAPCPQLEARALNRGWSADFDRVSVGAAAVPYGDEDWMASRVVEHGAVVGAHFAPGTHFAGGDESVLTASQVFVRIPDVRACADATVAACPSGQTTTFTRDSDRCVVSTGCVRHGICPLFRPSCPTGYTLAGWPSAPTACDAWACDPAFLGE